MLYLQFDASQGLLLQTKASAKLFAAGGQLVVVPVVEKFTPLSGPD